ncbi:Gypsy retrotransposon integrase-like protein 1 [Taxawa tesnikishii (nom. ined.)]|nr:Gypsy retrotransposon integrase-like protein 1 [Dothideales sp. JES 119]
MRARETADAERYFHRAKALVDITDCQDIVSLQTLLCMAMYLQASAQVSGCHSLICLGFSVSARIGLHRSGASQGFDSLQREVRKSIFWALRAMETYVGAMLGLPPILRDEDIDQELEVNMGDEAAVNHGESSRVWLASDMSAVNAHTRLTRIMAKVNNYVHVRSLDSSLTGSYRVPYSRIMEVEAELQEWFSQLQSQHPFDTPATSDFTSSHHLFAVMCLLMFVLSNNTDPTAPDALKAAHAGFKVLQRHSGANLPIKRCVSCLMPLFARIPSASTQNCSSGSVPARDVEPLLARGNQASSPIPEGSPSSEGGLVAAPTRLLQLDAIAYPSVPPESTFYQDTLGFKDLQAWLYASSTYLTGSANDPRVRLGTLHDVNLGLDGAAVEPQPDGYPFSWIS